jgi:hypothetical protein
LGTSYNSPGTQVSEKGEEATDGDGRGALPGMDGMPEGKENSNCWGSSNGYENDPRSLPVRLVVVPFVPGVPTILLAWLDGPAEREVRGCPRMSPSRNK